MEMGYYDEKADHISGDHVAMVEHVAMGDHGSFIPDVQPINPTIQ